MAVKGKSNTQAGTDVANTDNVKELINRPLDAMFDVPMAPGLTFDQYVESIHGEVVEFEGSPYTVVEKDSLIGKPFIITDEWCRLKQ